MALGSQKMKPPLTGCLSYSADGERKSINSELWHACAGPLVSLPPVGSLVYYFPQGHSEQVAASTQKTADTQIPNYPNLPSQLLCQLHNVTLHADVETDEVYAQLTLQPVNTYDKDAFLASDPSPKQGKQPTEFFCKTLTASDTSTHGGFSVPRRAAEKVFPPLDFSMQPPAQELVARDLHDNLWTFRHIYRGQPKRHLLTTGWSVFVSAKRLVAGDSVLFIRDEKAQLLLGIRRANRQQITMPSSVLSSDSMHIGVLAAAAHAAANHSPFTVFYNPRASPSEFVVPLAKYNKALYGSQISVGMRFRMMFETEESGVRRYMGTITGISDLDPVRWPNSQWRNLQVGWDESSAGERQNRASIWEIETVATPFFLCPPPFFRVKRPRQPGMGEETEMESTFKRSFPWIRDENVIGDFQNSISGVGLEQWMGLQQKPEIVNPAVQLEYYRSMAAAALQEFRSSEASKESCMPQVSQAHQTQFSVSQQRGHQPQPQFLWEQLQQQVRYQQRQFPSQQLPLQQDASIQGLQQQLHQQLLPQQQQSPLPQSQQQQQHSTLHPLKQSQPLQQLQQPLPHVIQFQHQPLQQLQEQPLQQLQQQHSLHQLQQQQQPPPTHQKQLALLPWQLQQQHQLKHSPSPQQHSHNQSPEYHLHSQEETQLQQSIIHHQSAQHQLHPPPQQSQHQVHLQSQQSQQQQVQQSSPQQLHGQKKSPEHHFHIQQQLQVQQPTQLTELEAQLLQSSSGRSQVAGCMPVPARSQSGFSESDVSFCSTSTSANSYPLQNILRRAHQDSVTSEEKSPYVNMFRRSPISTQGATLISNLVQEPPVSSWFPSIKEPDQSMLQGIPNVQSHQIETSSPSVSFSLTQANAAIQQSLPTLPSSSTSFWFKNTSQDGDVQVDPRNSFFLGANFGSPLVDPSTSSPLLARGFSSVKDAPCQVSAESMLSSFSTSKDVQPQISSASMLCSQSFAVPDLPVNSDVASTVELDDGNFSQRGSWQQLSTPVRTYTKVYKLGSVGRSIDVTRYKNYDELRCELARMFGLEGQLEDPKRSGWQLVFVDNEHDVLLVGDDPWEEFVSCVRCIKILSPCEVLQMSKEGMELLNSTPVQLQTSSCSEDGNVWRDPRYQNSTNPSAGSLDH